MIIVFTLCHLRNFEEINGPSAWFRLHGDHFKGEKIPFGTLVDFTPGAARNNKRAPHWSLLICSLALMRWLKAQVKQYYKRDRKSKGALAAIPCDLHTCPTEEMGSSFANPTALLGSTPVGVTVKGVVPTHLRRGLLHPGYHLQVQHKVVCPPDRLSAVGRLCNTKDKRRTHDQLHHQANGAMLHLVTNQQEV